MEKYFCGESVAGTHADIIKKIADRYMNSSPITDYSYIAYNETGFVQNSAGDWMLNFAEKFPEAKNGDWAYATAEIYSAEEDVIYLSLGLVSPAEIYINGEFITKTNIWDESEVFYKRREVEFKAKKGGNRIFVKCRKNALGFGCVIGTRNSEKFCTVFNVEKGALGWNWCGVFKEDAFEDVGRADANWLPHSEKFAFGKAPVVYAVSFLRCEHDADLCFDIKAGGSYEIYVDAQRCGNACRLTGGEHSLAIRLMNTAPDACFSCNVSGAELFLPGNIVGAPDCWLYLKADDEKAKSGFDGYTVYDGGEFFCCAENTYLRPVLAAELFGKSSYPVGVVLYGLLTGGKIAGDSRMIEYAHRHLLMSCAIKCLSEWDTERYGYTYVNNHLMHLTSLDDCGSYSAAVLEDYLYYNRDKRMLEFAEYIADYILKCQERLETGMFYREQPGKYHQLTAWTDDLYMSTPFMIRYYLLKRDECVLDDTVNQFICFKNLMYMPEKKLMSHIYSLKHKKLNRIPWGRGNGWVLFSLSELLKVLPKGHKRYGEILEFFTALAEGFYNAADSEGMLHQVLDMPESYAEVSCSAMCAAAFARGYKMGILPIKYAQAAARTVRVIERYGIDSEGNIYGVCIGSGYSFRREYYKDELGWRVNDTHGTGIVLIAIAEVESMEHEKER